jgi:hypothetical protein
MTHTKLVAAMAFAAALAAAPVVSSAQGPPPPPKPGPEHEVLKMDVGTWDATVEITAPGAPAMTSKGVEVNTLGCGGRCLITDFKGEMGPGMPFTGHGVTTWDVQKKKYVGSWTDSMSMGLSVGESTWDPAAKRMSGWMEGPNESGKVVRSKSLVEHKGGARVFTATMPGPDGQNMQLKITYVKKP